MKQKKYLKKILVVLLCYAMLPFSVPASAVNEPETATELAQIATTDTGIAMDETIAADDNAVLVKPEGAEVVSLREESVKHFDMGNGTYQAISYSHPVHELDSEGNWQDIDFSMHLTQTRGISTYTNTAGTALAANYIANQPILSMSGEDTAIDMTFIYAKEGVAARAGTVTTAVAEVTQAETAIETYEDTQDINFSNTLYYKDVMPGVDLEYIVDPWNVKENIIVKEKALSYTYMFKLNLEGMYPVLQQDGSIFVLNSQTDEKEYVIPAPYMYDAYGEMSFDVDYTVSGSNGTYYLSVTADSTWINAADRIFPITIDPTIYGEAQNATIDTYVIGEYPNETRGDHQFFYVGEDEFAYIYTPTPSLPEGAVIENAGLFLYYYYFDHMKSGYVDFTANPVTGFYWAEDSLTWNMARDYDNFGILTASEAADDSCDYEYQSRVYRAYAGAGATNASPDEIIIDVTNAFSAWTTGTPNQGIGLKMEVSSTNRSVRFCSTERTGNYKPRFAYSYTFPPAPPVYEVNLILQYDDAYAERYSNAQSRISAGAAVLEEFFREKFEIIVHSYEAENFESLYDQCEGTGTTCSCTQCHDKLEEPYHHSSMYANLAYLTQPDANSVKMAFLGSIACYPAPGSGCSYTFPYGCGGLSEENWQTMAINNFTSDSSEVVTMIHEMGHMFGAKDHYLVEENDTNRKECLYGYNGYKGENPEEIKLCNECWNTINSNRGRYSD